MTVDGSSGIGTPVYLADMYALHGFTGVRDEFPDDGVPHSAGGRA